jgi:ketosteroid isomerase-like protein
MTKFLRAAAACGLALLLSAPAWAQNLTLRAPPWAQPLIAADITPTTGGRAALVGDGVDVAVRVTVAPQRGGVARVIRYEARGDQAFIALRRFTGHPSTGWWLWGPDSPRVIHPTPAQRAELATLARAAIGVGGAVGASNEICQAGEQAFIEIAIGTQSTSLSRTCVVAGDPGGRLVQRLSDLAGSRNEEELSDAAVAELMEADRAFAAKAAADGVPAAFTEYAAEDAVLASSASVSNGRVAITQRFAAWPQGARLAWAPEAARVSARGDMGWTWGNSTTTLANGTRTTGRYISVWTRDYEGNWRFAFDAAVD